MKRKEKEPGALRKEGLRATGTTEQFLLRFLVVHKREMIQRVSQADPGNFTLTPYGVDRFQGNLEDNISMTKGELLNVISSIEGEFDNVAVYDGRLQLLVSDLIYLEGLRLVKVAKSETRTEEDRVSLTPLGDYFGEILNLPTFVEDSIRRQAQERHLVIHL